MLLILHACLQQEAACRSLTDKEADLYHLCISATEFSQTMGLMQAAFAGASVQAART